MDHVVTSNEVIKYLQVRESIDITALYRSACRHRVKDQYQGNGCWGTWMTRKGKNKRRS
jgi:hypothetical protein